MRLVITAVELVGATALTLYLSQIGATNAVLLLVCVLCGLVIVAHTVIHAYGWSRLAKTPKKVALPIALVLTVGLSVLGWRAATPSEQGLTLTVEKLSIFVMDEGNFIDSDSNVYFREKSPPHALMVLRIVNNGPPVWIDSYEIVAVLPPDGQRELAIRIQYPDGWIIDGEPIFRDEDIEEKTSIAPIPANGRVVGRLWAEWHDATVPRARRILDGSSIIEVSVKDATGRVHGPAKASLRSLNSGMVFPGMKAK